MKHPDLTDDMRVVNIELVLSVPYGAGKNLTAEEKQEAITQWLNETNGNWEDDPMITSVYFLKNYTTKKNYLAEQYMYPNDRRGRQAVVQDMEQVYQQINPNEDTVLSKFSVAADSPAACIRDIAKASKVKFNPRKICNPWLHKRKRPRLDTWGYFADTIYNLKMVVEDSRYFPSLLKNIDVRKQCDGVYQRGESLDGDDCRRDEWFQFFYPISKRELKKKWIGKDRWGNPQKSNLTVLQKAAQLKEERNDKRSNYR